MIMVRAMKQDGAVPSPLHGLVMMILKHAGQMERDNLCRLALEAINIFGTPEAAMRALEQEQIALESR